MVLGLEDEKGKRSGKIILRAEKVKRSMEYVYMRWCGHGIKDTRFFFFSKTCPFLRFFRIME
jgi:hypothetical protein